LRKQRRVRGRRGERRVLLAQRAQHGKRGDNRVPGGVLVEADDVARVLAAEDPTLLLHLFQHVAVTDGRALQRNAAPGQRLLEAGVDVHAIRLAANRDHLRTQLVEHGRRDVIRGTVRAIDDELQTLEIELVRVRALAELDVAAGGIVDAERLAQLLRRHAGDWL